MFEGTLVESRGLPGTGTERWTALGSMTVQLAVAGLLIAIPLLHPEALRMNPLAPPVALPLLHKPPVPVQVKTGVATTAMSLPAAAPQIQATRPLVFTHLGETAEGGPPLLPIGPGMTNTGPSGVGPMIVGIGSVPVVAVVRAREPGLTKVSQGVSEGLLLSPIQPVYPPIAKAIRLQGKVVIEAIISKTGRLESVNVVSGPDMLRKAATDAVAAARYRPYLLNGEPTEVKTVYTVVFSMGG
jgi:periplasmic protein TonB